MESLGQYVIIFISTSVDAHISCAVSCKITGNTVVVDMTNSSPVVFNIIIRQKEVFYWQANTTWQFVPSSLDGFIKLN